MFEKQATVVSELKKALTTGNASALIPYDLEQTLHEELLRLQPLASLMSFTPAEGKTHEYTLKTAHPMGWFEGESGTGSAQNGTYVRKTVAMKIMRIWGSVTGFAQKVDEKFIDALAEELAGSVQGMADVMEYGALFGISDDIGFTGDAYQFSGILPRIYAYAPENVHDAGGDKITLDDLDYAAYLSSQHRQTRSDPYLWFMGQRMKQVVDGLQTKIQLPLQGVTLADGKVTMAAYGNRPILETDYVVPAGTSTSPDDLAGTAAEGGSLAAGDYKYAIASVTAYGEQVASALTNAVTATLNQKITLTWTADANAKAYMIFRTAAGGSTGYLLDIIPALTYDANGIVNGTVATYVDTGAKSLITQVKPLAVGEQVIVTGNLNPARGASWKGLIDDMGSQLPGAITFVELARTGDFYGYFLKSYLALKLVYPNLFSAIRHCKLS